MICILEVKEKLSVLETENLARLYTVNDVPASERAEAPRSFKMVARALRQKYGTNVQVKTTRGKNKIEIEFKDEEDLARIFAIVAGPGSSYDVDEGDDNE